MVPAWVQSCCISRGAVKFPQCISCHYHCLLFSPLFFLGPCLFPCQEALSVHCHYCSITSLLPSPLPCVAIVLTLLHLFLLLAFQMPNPEVVFIIMAIRSPNLLWLLSVIRLCKICCLVLLLLVIVAQGSQFPCLLLLFLPSLLPLFATGAEAWLLFICCSHFVCWRLKSIREDLLEVVGAIGSSPKVFVITIPHHFKPIPGSFSPSFPSFLHFHAPLSLLPSRFRECCLPFSFFIVCPAISKPWSHYRVLYNTM